MTYTIEDANEFLGRLAKFAQQLDFRLTSLDQGRLVAFVPYQNMLVRDIGMICGQSILTAADSLGPIAVASKAGAYREMATTNLNCQFLKALPPGDMRVVAKAIKVGQRLSLAQMDFYAGKTETHGATAIATYAHL